MATPPADIVPQLKAAAQFLRSAGSLLITSHVNSDGDGIAGGLAIAGLARQLGHDAVIVLQDVPAGDYSFLAGWDDLTQAVAEPAVRHARAVVLDCPTLDRIGETRAHLADDVQLLNIDHHHDNEAFGAVNLFSAGVCSTCEMIYHLAVHLDLDIDVDMAEQLYTGIAFDTGGFRYSLTTATSMEVGADLVRRGARFDRLADRLFNSDTFGDVKIIGRAIDSMTLHCDDRLATMILSYARSLAGKSLCMLFQKTSTRTRCSGEVGMYQLGGQAVFLDWRSTNFGLADLGDEARVLSRYFDFVLARFLDHDDVVTLAQASDVPVMNGCCNRYHPLQALCDLQTVQERLGRLEGVHLVYVGVHNNVANSLIVAGVKTGMRITVVAPERNEAAVDEDLLREARASGLYTETPDLAAALSGADAVYTDTWLDMEYFDDPDYAEEKARRVRLFEPYRLTRERLGDAAILVMHCLPAHRGYEIDGDVVEDPRSIVFDQAENRLHSQKAVLLELAGLLA